MSFSTGPTFHTDDESVIIVNMEESETEELLHKDEIIIDLHNNSNNNTPSSINLGTYQSFPQPDEQNDNNSIAMELSTLHHQTTASRLLSPHNLLQPQHPILTNTPSFVFHERHVTHSQFSTNNLNALNTIVTNATPTTNSNSSSASSTPTMEDRWKARTIARMGGSADVINQSSNNSMSQQQVYRSSPNITQVTPQQSYSTVDYVFPTNPSPIDNSLRELEGRKAVTLRHRQIHVFCAIIYIVLAIANIVSRPEWVSIGLLFAAAAFHFLAYPLICSKKRIASESFLSMLQLRWAVHFYAAVAFASCIEGSALNDKALSVALWYLPYIPLFVAFMLQESMKKYDMIGWGVTVILGLVGIHIGYAMNDGEQEYFRMVARIALTLLSMIFAQANQNTIASHIAALHAREEFSIQQGRLLSIARDQAQASATAKSEFLKTMSHEIRTPLNSVLGLCSLLIETTLTADQRDLLTTVIKSAESLLVIINDILFFSKLESGEFVLEYAKYSPTACIEDVLAIFALTARSKNIDLVAHIHDGIPSPVYGDSMRLRQILSNLVSNALKFTSSGDVVVSARPYVVSPDTPSHLVFDGSRAQAQQQDTLIHFSVKDTGIGIPESKKQLLFQAFQQSDMSDTRQHGGIGLGLAISKRLVYQMKGNIWFESTEGQGSTFHFTIAAGTAANSSSIDSSPSCSISNNYFTNHMTDRLKFSTSTNNPAALSVTLPPRHIIPASVPVRVRTLHHQSQPSTGIFRQKTVQESPSQPTSKLLISAVQQPLTPTDSLASLLQTPKQLNRSHSDLVAPSSPTRANNATSQQDTSSHNHIHAHQFFKLQAPAVKHIFTSQTGSLTPPVTRVGSAANKVLAPSSRTLQFSKDSSDTKSITTTSFQPDLIIEPKPPKSSQSPFAARLSEAKTHLRNRRLLIVDTETSARALEELTKTWGLQVRVVTSLPQFQQEATKLKYPVTRHSPKLILPPLLRIESSLPRINYSPSITSRAIHNMSPSLAHRHLVAEATTMSISPTLSARLLPATTLQHSRSLGSVGQTAANVTAPSNPIVASETPLQVFRTVESQAVNSLNDFTPEIILIRDTIVSEWEHWTPEKLLQQRDKAAAQLSNESPSTTTRSTLHPASSVTVPPQRPMSPLPAFPSFILQTTHLELDSIQQAKEQGYSAVLQRPVRRLNLLRALMTSLGYDVDSDVNEHGEEEEEKDEIIQDMSSPTTKTRNTSLLNPSMSSLQLSQPSTTETTPTYSATTDQSASTELLPVTVPSAPTNAISSLTLPELQLPVVSVAVAAAQSSPVANQNSSEEWLEEGEASSSTPRSLSNNTTSVTNSANTVLSSLESTPSLQPIGATTATTGLPRLVLHGIHVIEAAGGTVDTTASNTARSSTTANDISPNHITSTSSCTTTFSFTSTQEQQQQTGTGTLTITPSILAHQLLSPTAVMSSTPVTPDLKNKQTLQSEDGADDEGPPGFARPSSVDRGTAIMLAAAQAKRNQQHILNQSTSSSLHHHRLPLYPSSSSPDETTESSTPNSAPSEQDEEQQIATRLKRAAAAQKLSAKHGALNILVVEDNLTNVKVIERMLKHLGYSCDIAEDGVVGVEMMQSRNIHREGATSEEDFKPYDLVFMDMQMPRMGGVEATRLIRSEICPILQPRIVALTANVLPADRELCLAAGSDDFHTKPIVMAKLQSVIKETKQITRNSRTEEKEKCSCKGHRPWKYQK